MKSMKPFQHFKDGKANISSVSPLASFNPFFFFFFCNSSIILFLLLCRDGEFSSSDIFFGQILSSVNRQLSKTLL